MRRWLLFASFFPLMILLAAPELLRAQAVGQILGTVRDPSGAVVPNAKVTATQQATAFTRSTITDSIGNYVMPNLPVGIYVVTAEASGFKTATSTDITLDVNQQREVAITLALAGTATKVEVNAAPSLLTTTNATLGGLVTGQQVSELPLNGRDITELAMLMPGVTIEPDIMLPLSSNPSGSNFVASNGNRGTTGASYIDGLDTSDNEFGGASMTNFNLDAIAQFKVLQNNYSADYGRGAGNIIQVVSKSGTNQLHGSAFEYLRNSVLDARNFFATTVPPFQRNEFGGTISGPVVLPGLYNGKDRTFFFFEYAGFRQRLGEPVLIPVPTAQERQGVVNIVGSNGQPDQLKVPLTADAQTILNGYPLPNQPNGPLGPRTFNFEYKVPQTTNQWSARGDYRVSDKDSLFVRATQINNHRPIMDPVAAVLNSEFPGSFSLLQQNYGLTETHVFTPTLLHTFRFAYSESGTPWTERNTSLTQSTFTDGSLATWGPDNSEFAIYDGAFIFNDTVNWVKGRHSINTGVDYRRTRDNGLSVPAYVNGTYLFNPGVPISSAVPSASGLNNLAAGSPSPSSLVSFMLGDATTYLKSTAFPGYPTYKNANGGGFGLRRSSVAGWFQDDFRATPKLTLNLGLRYEFNSVPYDVGGRLFGVVDDPNLEGGKVYRRYVLNPVPMWHDDYAGVAPRFGMAYRLNDKTVWRGGFAVFTNLILMETADQQPFAGVSGTTSNPVFSINTLPATGVPILTDLNGNPIVPPDGDTKKIPGNTPVDLLPIVKYLGGPFLFDTSTLNLRNGYTMAGNFTLERQLPGDIALQAGYVFNNAAKLFASNYPNAYYGAQPAYTPYTLADPGLSEFQVTDNHAHSTYNSLQVMARKVTPTHGLQFQVSYTYSKTIDSATTVFNGPATQSAELQNNPTCWRCEKAASAFDFPQRIVANLTYTVPLDKWQAASFLPRRLAQGWQITSIIQAQSGFPFTVTSPYGTVQYGTDIYIGTQATRPYLLQQPTLKTGAGPEEQFFSNAVIANNGMNGQFLGVPTTTLPNGAEVQTAPGNLGRNTFRTGTFSNVDFSVLKDTKITERLTLQFRSEFFNLFNQHAFNVPASVLGSPGFGVASSTVLPEREIQFGLKLLF